MLTDNGETGGGRRRSTFYVPLAENKTTPSSAADRKMQTSSSSTSGGKKSQTVTSPEKTVNGSGGDLLDRKRTDETPKTSLLRSAAPQRVIRSRPVASRIAVTSLSKGVIKSQNSPKPLLTVTKTIDGPEGPQVPILMPVQKSPSLSPTARIRSPLLKVSAKLLSSSAQALEVINRSPSASPAKTASQHSPLTLIRRSSSRKLSRSSSTILTRTSSTKLSASCRDDPVKDSTKSLHVDTSSSVPVIVIDQSPDEKLLSSAADKAQERRHVKIEDDEDTGVHSGEPSSFGYNCTLYISFSAKITIILKIRYTI